MVISIFVLKCKFHLSEHYFQHYMRVKQIRNLLSKIEDEEVCYIAQLRVFSAYRLAPLIIGFVLFFKAKDFSRSISFQYVGGITFGVVLSAFGKKTFPVF